MPRCCSIAIQSDRVRRRSPRALTCAGQLDGAAEQQQLFGQRGLAGVGCEMIANVRRRAISGGMSASARAVCGIKFKIQASTTSSWLCSSQI